MKTLLTLALVLSTVSFSAFAQSKSTKRDALISAKSAGTISGGTTLTDACGNKLPYSGTICVTAAIEPSALATFSEPAAPAPASQPIAAEPVSTSTATRAL